MAAIARLRRAKDRHFMDISIFADLDLYHHLSFYAVAFRGYGILALVS